MAFKPLTYLFIRALCHFSQVYKALDQHSGKKVSNQESYYSAKTISFLLLSISNL